MTKAQEVVRVFDAYGERMPFANVRLVPEEKNLGPADSEGELTLPSGLKDEQLLAFSYLGYEEVTITLAALRALGYRFTFGDAAVTLAMPEVVGRRNEIAADLPYKVETVDRAAISRAQSLTTADALADLSGVYVQKSQFGGGSPVVRGFEANRVLLVVDGVRMNNAIFRSGHLQNAITVDPLALDRMELIYGAGALAYGSDALGGVIHFRTRRPDFVLGKKGAGTRGARWKFSGALFASSAAKVFGQSVRASYGTRNFAALTLLSKTSTSHLRAGARRSESYRGFGFRNQFAERVDGVDTEIDNPDPNRQIGTAFGQFNLLQKFRFRLKNKLELSANIQFSTTSDVPRYDALTERRNGRLRWARWDYGPQTRALAALRLDDRRGTRLYDVASYLLSYQFVEEDRLRRRFGDPGEEASRVDVGATNLQIDFAKDLGFLALRYGLDLRYDRVESSATLRDILTGAVDAATLDTRYPSGGSDLTSGGAYLEGSHRLAEYWRLRGGLRWSRQRLGARFGADDPTAWPTAYTDGIRNTESAVTAALGLIHDTGHHRWRTLFAQGFRAPNVDDFAKFRERNGFVQIPNPTLQPERSNTLETGYQFRSADERLRLGATVYHTWLNKAIIRRDGVLPGGSPFFVSRGDTLFVQANVNAESARIYGLDLDASYRFGRGFTASTAFHYLRGRRRQLAPDGPTLELPQDHIPPPYGHAALAWVTGPWTASVRLRYQFAKDLENYAVGEISGDASTGYRFDRTGTSDNLEFTPTDDDGRFTGTPAWWTANAYVSWMPSDRWSVSLKAENLLDRHYRTFASGVSAAGVDVGVSARVNF